MKMIATLLTFLLFSSCVPETDKDTDIGIATDVLGIEWISVESGFMGSFRVQEDGSLSGSDGCNSCRYSSGSVFFLENGIIQWNSSEGPTCTEKACFPEQMGMIALISKNNAKTFLLNDDELTIYDGNQGAIRYAPK